MEGSGRMVVAAVGVNSQAGIIFTLLGAAQTEENDAQKNKEKKKKGPDRPAETVTDAAEAEALAGSDEPRKSTSGGGGGDTSHAHEKSVLQAKLTKLAIQIGYAG